MPHDALESKRNTARFFVETRHISWVLLAGTLAWGVFGYFHMPQRKDPDIPVRLAVVLTVWPGASAERVEQLVTKRVEAKIGENSKVTEIRSISRTSLSVVYLQLDERVEQPSEQLDDIKLKLDTIQDLPDGAGPIQFLKDFGDTAALMLTVASPPASESDVALRARDVERAIRAMRGGRKGTRATVVVAYPQSIDPNTIRRSMERSVPWMEEHRTGSDAVVQGGPGFYAIDFNTSLDDAGVEAAMQEYLDTQQQPGDFHPDAWQPVLIRDPQRTGARLETIASDRYSYRELDDFTDLIEKTVKTAPQVSKVTRSGIVPECDRLGDMTYPLVGGFALTGGTCAAASAGVLAIGLATGTIETSYARVMAMMARMFVGGDAMMMPDHVNNFNPAINRGRVLVEWFERTYGTMSCAELTGLTIRESENAGRYFSEGGLERCEAMAAAVAGKAREIIEGTRRK